MGKYVVMDLEMCRVPRSRQEILKNCKTEVIQIGAVLLGDSLTVEDEFNTFVSPQVGVINSYISDLTGITRAQTKGAPVFEEAIETFLAWTPKEAKLATWSRADELQLRKESQAKGINNEELWDLLEETIDVQELFGKKIEIERPYKLEEALVLSDIFYEGRLHDGLVDARNTAELFVRLISEENFAFNPFYLSAKSENVEHLLSSLGGLLADLNLEKCCA